MSVENKLPEGWVETKLDTLTTDVSYGYTASSTDSPIGPQMLRITDIQDGKVNWESVPYCEIDDNKKSKYLLQKNDLVFARTGATVGKSFLIKEQPPEAVYASYLIRVRVASDELIAMLAHFFNSDSYWRQITEFSAGIGQPNVNGTKLKGLTVPLPPLAEQQVIADQLDSLLAQVEATKTRLERIPDTLKRFRQSVLADAVSGRLTEEWRSQHKLDSVSDLSSELVLNDGKAKKVESTSGHELMTEIFPPSWEVSTFNLLYRFIDYRGKTPKKSDSGKRLYSAKNIKMGWLSDEPIEYLDESDYTAWMTRGFTNLGDIFFVTEGHTMGCVAINDIGSDIALAQRTLTLQPYGKINTKFHFYYMLTAEFQRLVELNATGSAAKGIKSAKFRGLPAPFPSFKEQNQIVRRVEQLFAYADRVEQQANAALVQVGQLTQSILAKAFRGELTAGWRAANPELVSGDNSAVALLARIKEERAAVVRSGRKIKAEV